MRPSVDFGTPWQPRVWLHRSFSVAKLATKHFLHLYTVVGGDNADGFDAAAANDADAIGACDV